MNTREKHIPLCLMIAAVLALWIEQGFALTQFKDGGTHNMISTINDDVWVDFQTPGLGTTVNVLGGGTILSPYRLQGFNDSKLNLLDGYVFELFANNNSQLTVSGGALNSVFGYHNSQVTMSGGVSENLLSYDNSQVTMTGGSVYNLTGAFSGHVMFSSGNARLLSANANSHVTMSGGFVSQNLLADDQSITILSGGTIASDFLLKSNAKLIIDGYGIAVDGIPFGPGTITSLLGGHIGFEPHRRITGWLANGDVLNNEFKIGDAASITIVPEPSAYSLLALGTILLLFHKKVLSGGQST